MNEDLKLVIKDVEKEETGYKCSSGGAVSCQNGKSVSSFGGRSGNRLLWNNYEIEANSFYYHS